MRSVQFVIIGYRICGYGFPNSRYRNIFIHRQVDGFAGGISIFAYLPTCERIAFAAEFIRLRKGVAVACTLFDFVADECGCAAFKARRKVDRVIYNLVPLCDKNDVGIPRVSVARLIYLARIVAFHRPTDEFITFFGIIICIGTFGDYIGFLFGIRAACHGIFAVGKCYGILFGLRFLGKFPTRDHFDVAGYIRDNVTGIHGLPFVNPARKFISGIYKITFGQYE